jgi:hypothetical protein
MNRLDQLTSELRSKLQADWLFEFTETDQSKPVTMGVTSSDLDGQARLPVRGLQWPHCSGGLRRRYWRARPHEGLSQFEGLMVLVLTKASYESWEAQLTCFNSQACRPWVCRVCHGTPRFWQIS